MTRSRTKRVMIGTPAGDGTVCVPYLRSILESWALLTAANWQMSMHLVIQDSLVMHARNEIVSYFMNSAAEDLVMIDSDIGWVPRDLVRLLRHDVPLVAGVYQRKSEEKVDFTVKFPAAGVVRDMQTGLLKAERVGTGFMRLRRDALELMRKKYQHLSYEDKSGQVEYCLFDTSISNGQFCGEDFTFCDRWRAIGGEVWVDPDIRLSHIGSKTFDKPIWDVLRPQDLA